MNKTFSFYPIYDIRESKDLIKEIIMSNECEKIRQEYENLKARLSSFEEVVEKTIANAKTLREVKQVFQEAQTLKTEMDALKEKIWPFESLPQKELKEQYESQKETLERVGILEELSIGEKGIKGIDNKEYVFPTYQEIVQRMRKNKEILKTKTEQGFKRLLIVPFGMKLDDLIEKYKQVILKHYMEGKLLATKEKETDPDEPLQLDTDWLVHTWGEYNNGDINGKLVYFPEEFSKENHGGKTKQEVIEERGGYSVMFIEDLPSILIRGKEREVKGRKQLGAGQTPSQYLETLKTNPIYQNETGMTPEDWIIYAIFHLEQTNQVIDYHSVTVGKKKGSMSYQLGASFPAYDFVPVPCAGWIREVRRANLEVRGYDNSDSRIGARTVVRV